MLMLILLLQPSTPHTVVLLVKINPAPEKASHAALDVCAVKRQRT
jgi:hypothetical protein